ncbi:hypothetical protein E4P41_11455 [Geodermatophilus sp. DF01-2]|uniref:hypothetical protein n=1 Tax=Geodermatophilus sp. DF01-2 TaxID=2559610 RepID=UPI001073F62C|nr:hypothetical protein [Geodermatophilus sp. DF01_2]TFV59599.1 hypothetical protein E4P41_11455 [Geodermatophilus sp. DF01_2]
MDSSAPAAVPWVVLVLALLALAGLAAAELAGRRGRQMGPPAASEPGPPVAARPEPRWPDDDLPGFLETPPGTPGTRDDAAAPAGPAPRPGAPPPEDGTARSGPPDDSRRAVAGMAAAALVLVAVIAGVAAATRDGGVPLGQPVPGTGTASPQPGGTATPPPDATVLPGVPAHPLPGEGGAGALAARSVPLGEDGVLARLTFGGIVVERHAVGTAVAYPSVSVTASGDGGAALAHLRLPSWNCLTPEPPADPAQAGCVRSRTEYAELPSPALTVTRDGRDLRLTGRFPTYTRPIGTAPAYTGRVYDLTVTASPAEPVRDGVAAARGTLFLGTDRTATVDVPGLNAVRYAG